MDYSPKDDYLGTMKAMNFTMRPASFSDALDIQASDMKRPGHFGASEEFEVWIQQIQII